MEAYFFDASNRYIGHRELNDGEQIPICATIEAVNVGEGQEAYFVNDEWTVTGISEDPYPPPISPPAVEDRLMAAEEVIMEMLEMMML
jgi:hypothetical protein